MSFYLSQTSLSKLDGIHSQLVEFMKELIKISPYDFKITQGVRTAEYQNALYQQGRTKPGPKVTNCDGHIYKSNHQVKSDGLGYAVDIAILVYKFVKDQKTGKVIKQLDWNGKYYDEVYEFAKKYGLLEKYGVEWGGNCFRNFIDKPHWQIKNANKIK